MLNATKDRITFILLPKVSVSVTSHEHSDQDAWIEVGQQSGPDGTVTLDGV